jgi:hypothetical protein
MVQFHHGAYRYARFYLIPRHSGNKGESQELLFMHYDKLRFNGELSFFLNPPWGRALTMERPTPSSPRCSKITAPATSRRSTFS